MVYAGQESSGIATMKQQLKLMEQEVTKLRKQQQAVLSRVNTMPAATAVATAAVSLQEPTSVVVQNVHFSATPQILSAHFSG